MSIFKQAKMEEYDKYAQEGIWALDQVDHPDYYGGEENPYEAINVIEAWGLDFHCGNVVKYIARHKEKDNPKQDIEKAIWYLQRYLKTLGD